MLVHDAERMVLQTKCKVDDVPFFDKSGEDFVGSQLPFCSIHVACAC